MVYLRVENFVACVQMGLHVVGCADVEMAWIRLHPRALCCKQTSWSCCQACRCVLLPSAVMVHLRVDSYVGCVHMGLQMMGYADVR
jgi:hypothetical protein